MNIIKLRLFLKDKQFIGIKTEKHYLVIKPSIKFYYLTSYKYSTIRNCVTVTQFKIIGQLSNVPQVIVLFQYYAILY